MAKKVRDENYLQEGDEMAEVDLEGKRITLENQFVFLKFCT